MDVVDEGSCNRPILFDGKRIPLADGSRDVVLASFVLHQVPHYEDLLREIFRVSGSYVVLAEDTPQNGFARWGTRVHARVTNWGTCDRCFRTVDEWIELVEGNGWGECIMKKPLASFATSKFMGLYYTQRHILVFRRAANIKNP